MLQPDVRALLDGTPVAHLATLLPDGSPHSVPLWIATRGDQVAFLTGPASRKARNLRRDPRVAISLTPADAPFPPALIRGRVVRWIDGDEGWAIVDEISQKYTGGPYGRDQERVIGLIEVEHQHVGL
ncbi:PPOX class probable F420-dependent enzyme [Nocardioides terrae]|uniref:PPOX class probable F420-dependent enzyme n=1 Tax=Nocardioides terrae TaxID=574651 RepID=A0A1I1MUN5_9ACTN|nr:PPOX class F420-dependent oxidoreductase [Nocardioides terrae]SFC89069.1 PPOX class probable F420-dependent enzyme [Nocardioides terrae]